LTKSDELRYEVKRLKAISVRQPWAEAIIHNGKFIENRSWPTEFRGLVCIHASKTRDDYAMRKYIKLLERVDPSSSGHLPRELDSLPLGAIVGVAEVVDCVTFADSAWFEGPFGFVLHNVRPIEPVPCRGALGFFDLPIDVLEKVLSQLEIT